MPSQEANAVGGTLQERVVRTIRNDIEAGRLVDGEALPSTRDLAKQMEVSVFTINEAMKSLASEGLIENRPGSRRIVRSSRPVTPPDRAGRPPHTYFVGGYAGSGKSEFGRVLARLTGAAVIDKDTITRAVVESHLEDLGRSPHDRESETYLDRVRPREYENLLATVLENAELGVGVIATAPFVQEFSSRAWIDRTRAQLDAHGVGLTLVWVTTDVETMHIYLRRRGAARDSVKLANWDDYVATRIDTDFRPAGAHVVIENSADSEPLQSQAARMLAEVAASR
ncbi:GntR family transcriptional regulator [Promicromonospora thailandica]|uniref:Regulatory protein, gntR family n=1 Tax=Promicromonospora thailandica TaxID=765201 RepID=A0A9X2G3G7_9MICO|nr:GntR family transcriptional regulator [Promicromonospora thailandica]MCP2266395.1 regulatory protein, gntR family [Promicromonospora thailandica]